MHRVILILVAGLTLIITACASQKTQQPPGANFPDPNGFAPPPLPAASSAPAASAPVPPQPEKVTAAEKPGAAAVAAAPAAVLEAAAPSADPVPELAADRAAGKVEELGEISSSTAAAPPPATGQLCKMDNCGVIVAIYRGAPQLDVQPDWGWGMYSDPYYGYGPYVGGGIDAWDSPMGPYDSGYVVTTAPALWQIEVQMNTGSKRLIQQNYRPFLQLGDPVLVDGNNVRLWN